jgi:molybdate transport system permease protein
MKYYWTRFALAASGGLLLLFLVLPLLALLLETTFSELLHALQTPFVLKALKLSGTTTSLSLTITVLLGTPLAWTLAGSNGRLSQLAETLVQLPLVIPPAVAGIALLMAFGRHGYVTRLLHLESGFAFSTVAVVMAEVFVAAPYFVQGATSAFRGLDTGVLLVAQSLGAGPLRILTRIALPMAYRGLIAAAAASWARALGEFGATLMFAGSFEGKTQTMPLAIYAAFESDFRVAVTLGVILLSVAAAVLVFSRAFSGTAGSRSRSYP